MKPDFDEEILDTGNSHLDENGIEHRIFLESCPKEIEERYKLMLQAHQLQKGLDYAVKKENYEAAKILKERLDKLKI